MFAKTVFVGQKYLSHEGAAINMMRLQITLEKRATFMLKIP